MSIYALTQEEKTISNNNSCGKHFVSVSNMPEWRRKVSFVQNAPLILGSSHYQGTVCFIL